MGPDQKEALPGFEAVWRRVTAAAAPSDPPAVTPEAGPGDSAVLIRLIEGSMRCIRLYSLLAGRCGGHARSTLLRLAAEDRRRLRRLQTELFLLRGDDHAPRLRPEPPAGMLSALRSAYAVELDLAGCCQDAARCCSEELRELYLRCAAEGRLHAAALRRLIERAMG